MRNISVRLFLPTIFALLIISLSLPVSQALAMGGESGGEPGGNLVRPGGPAKSTTKSSRWNDLVASTLRSHQADNKLEYYFKSKTRMRRLFRRLTQEAKETGAKKPTKKSATTDAIWNQLVSFERMSGDTGKRAKLITKGFGIYTDYKLKKISFRAYQKQMLRMFGFVP